MFDGFAVFCKMLTMVLSVVQRVTVSLCVAQCPTVLLSVV